MKDSSSQKKLTSSHQLLLETHSKWSLHYLTGHKLQWFVPFVAKPVLYLATLNIVIVLVGKLPSISSAYNQVFIPVAFIIEVATFIWLGWYVMNATKQKSLPLGMNTTTAFISGLLTGIFLGIILALFRIFWFQEQWTFLNLYLEPAIRALEGGVITLISGLVSIGIHKRSKS